MTQDQPNRLDNLEATLIKFAELTIQNVRRHDEALSRLEANAARHDEALERMEGTVTNFGTRMDQLGSQVEVMTKNGVWGAGCGV